MAVPDFQTMMLLVMEAMADGEPQTARGRTLRVERLRREFSLPQHSKARYS